jgi:LemA protein
MATTTAILTAMLAATALLGLIVMVVYNRLVVLRNRCANAFSQIDVQLRRRYDLVPNLVEAVRAYLAHERGTLEAVIRARDAAAGARLSSNADPSQLGALELLGRADQALSGALVRLRAVAESYPALKADQVVRGLMEDLRSAENRVGYARQAYNDAVLEFNQARESFPAVALAGVFGFGPAALWRLDGPGAEPPAARAAPSP